MHSIDATHWKDIPYLNSLAATYVHAFFQHLVWLRKAYKTWYDFDFRILNHVVVLQLHFYFVEYLIENLTNGAYECTICYGSVGQEKAVWSCGKCYHLFHFYCIKKWANTLISQDVGECTLTFYGFIIISVKMGQITLKYRLVKEPK